MPGEQGPDHQQLEVSQHHSGAEKKNWRSSLSGAGEWLRRALDKKRASGASNKWDDLPTGAAEKISRIKNRQAQINQISQLVTTDTQELDTAQLEELSQLVTPETKELNRMYAAEQARINEDNRRRKEIEDRRDARVKELMAEKDMLRAQRAALKHDRNEVSLDNTPTYFKVAAQRDLLTRNMQLLDLIAYWEEAKAQYEIDGYHESQFMFPLVDEYYRLANDLSHEVEFSVGSLPLKAEAEVVETKIEDFRRMLRGTRARVQKAIEESMQGVQFLPNQPEASSEHLQPKTQTPLEEERASPLSEPTL